MRDLKTVIAFTIKDMVRRKSFIISTFIILILIVIGFNIPNILNIFINFLPLDLIHATIIIYYISYKVSYRIYKKKKDSLKTVF